MSWKRPLFLDNISPMDMISFMSEKIISIGCKWTLIRLPAREQLLDRSNPSTKANQFITYREDRLPHKRACFLGIQGPDGGMHNVVVAYPSNLEGISFRVNIPKMLGKETIISSFDVMNSQSPFIFWQTHLLPSNKGRFTFKHIPSP